MAFVMTRIIIVAVIGMRVIVVESPGKQNSLIIVMIAHVLTLTMRHSTAVHLVSN
jgi:hypothetical protein